MAEDTLEPCCFKPLREHGVALESQGKIFTNFYLHRVHGKLFKPVWKDTEISQIFVSFKDSGHFIQVYKDSDQVHQDSDQINQDSEHICQDFYPTFKILALISNLKLTNK